MNEQKWITPVRALHARRPSFSVEDFAILSEFWYPLARAQDIGGDQPVKAMLLDIELIIYMTKSGYHVARDLCPHRGVPLSMGNVEGDDIVCVYHGLRYGPNGACTHIPAHPDARPAPSLTVTHFPAVEKYGLIWTCLSPKGEAQIPNFPRWGQDGYNCIVPPPTKIAASAGRQVEGFIDVAHFAWIHDKSFADRAAPAAAPYTIRPTETGFSFEYLSDVSNYPKSLQHLQPPGFKWLRIFEIFLPFTAALTVRFPRDGLHNVLNAACPCTAQTTQLFSLVARNFVETGSEVEAASFKIQIVHEDQDIAENQFPIELPLDLASEGHFGADKASLMYRRRLSELGLSLLPRPQWAR
jgi:phenylpropionate dioxygenase-like ring-hydroxylating dioxygenase large terminal subunit